MAEICAFQGWRYDVAQAGDLTDVVAPPYDVIDEVQQAALYARHPYNVVRLDLNRSEPDDVTPDARYERAASLWKHWRVDGVLRQEHEEALYVYHQEYSWEGQTFLRKGIVGRLRLEEFGAGKVFPHEQTLSGPKADRLKLIRASRANFSPIFGLYSDPNCDIQRQIDDHCIGLTSLEARDDNGVRNRLWVVTDPAAINRAKEALLDKPVFIADGHHRYETSLNYRNELRAAGKLANENAPPNFILATLVSLQDPGLTVLPTHRLVQGLAGLTAAAVQESLAGTFETEIAGTGAAGAREAWELVAADGGQDVLGFGCAADQQWIFARCLDPSAMDSLAADHSPAWRDLGVSLLHTLVLGKLLASRVTGAGPELRYVHRDTEVAEAVRSGVCDLGCLVPPATVDHVEEIAGGLETMPPKSTYFYPKLLSGLVFHSLT